MTNQRSTGTTPSADLTGSADPVEELLATRSDPNEPDPTGDLVLEERDVVGGGRWEIIRLVIDEMSVFQPGSSS